MNAESLTEKTYLGDGVYAGFDGYQIWIWTSDGISNSQPIALDHYVFKALETYCQIWTRKANKPNWEAVK